jgi:hypothetical protein
MRVHASEPQGVARGDNVSQATISRLYAVKGDEWAKFDRLVSIIA